MPCFDPLHVCTAKVPALGKNKKKLKTQSSLKATQLQLPSGGRIAGKKIADYVNAEIEMLKISLSHQYGINRSEYNCMCVFQ